MALKIYPNGLRLSVVPKTGAKLISVDMHITSGTQSEKNYESGISAFLARILLKGTKKHPSQMELVNYAKNNGIILKSDSTSESVIVSVATVEENVDKAIDLLCEIAFESTFSVSAGDEVRNSLLFDIAKLQENPSYVLERMINQALFYRTGLANPKFGTNTTIERMKAEDAKEYLERVLTPKNTIISVVGDVDADAIYEKVMQTFYNKFIEGGEYKKLKYVSFVEDYVGGERVKNKKLNQSRINFAFPCVSYKASNKYALEIVAPILMRRIRENLNGLKYFHNETVSFDLYANNGKFVIETMVDHEHATEYLDSIISGLKTILQTGVAVSDFENEKNEYIIKFLQRNETVSDISKYAIREVAVNKQSYSVASELMKVELITINDVNKIIKETINFSKMFIAYLGIPIEINVSDYID